MIMTDIETNAAFLRSAYNVAMIGRVINGNKLTGPLIPKLKKNTIPASTLQK